MPSSTITEVIRIPTRIAGGTYACTGRFSGETGARMGRHASLSKNNRARSLRKKQRRELNRLMDQDSSE